MGKPFSMDLRTRVVAAIEAGESHRSVAKRFAVGISTVGHWYRRKQRTGSVAPARMGPPEGSKLDAYEGFIFGLIEAQKDITLQEIADQLQAEHGVRVVPPTIWYFLDRRGITFKKRQHTQLNKSAKTFG